MQTKLFRQQHGDILRSLSEVKRLAADAPEQEVSLALSRLAGVVKLHLTLEDQNMYPRMLAHADVNVRETAERYQHTMGELAPVYIAFHETWTKPGAIDAQRQAFLRDFGQIEAALQQRIALENEGLYDLIDRVDLALV